MDIYSLLWRIHAILMAASFTAMITGIVVTIAARKTKWWFKAHRRLGFFGGIGAVAALFLAVLMIGLTHGFHFSNIHTLIGAIAMVLIIVTFILPPIIRGIDKKAQPGVRKLHMALGGISLAAMLAVIILGLRLVGIF